MVKIEQEMRAMPDKERRIHIDRFLPIVEAMAGSDEGRDDLAAICSAYFREHRPETTVVDTGPAEKRRDGPARRDPEGGGGGRGRGGQRRRKPRRGRGSHS